MINSVDPVLNAPVSVYMERNVHLLFLRMHIIFVTLLIHHSQVTAVQHANINSIAVIASWHLQHHNLFHPNMVVAMFSLCCACLEENKAGRSTYSETLIV